jgi:hypothetical protein
MFENIEAYYPINFVGDEDNHSHNNVNLNDISLLLDRCLCHPMFKQSTYDLLIAKISAPPISKFIPTVLLYIKTNEIELES